MANSEKSCNWSITINNPTADDIQQWESLKGQHWIKEVNGQLEKGENGTLHIQGMIKTTSVRFSQVKKALPRAHIEVAKNVNALKNYVNKEETRVASIPTAKVATQSDVQNRILTVLEENPNLVRGFTIDKFMEADGFYPGLDTNWEIITDIAVESLIKEGYYGVEFVLANPQIRSAFKKYFSAILYRTIKNRRPKELFTKVVIDGEIRNEEGQDSEA